MLVRTNGSEATYGYYVLKSCFYCICVKVWNPNEIGSLKENVAITISFLEKEFPPSFFDIITHLLLHVVDELEICGPIHHRWMYPMEWMMKLLKGYVHNMSQPKGSMVEGYILDETMGFVIEYLQEF
jgi:hypothetical protein